MRKTHLVAAAGGVALLGLTLAVRLALDVDRYRESAQAALAARLGRAVSLGHMSATLAPLGVRAQRVTIAEDPAFRTIRPFLQAEAVDLQLDPFALLRGRLDVRGVTLAHPVIELAQDSRGTWNLASLARDGTVRDLRLDHVNITDGQLSVTQAGRRTVYPIAKADLQHFGNGRAADLTAVVTLPDQRVVSVSATLQPEEGCLSARGELRVEETRVHDINLGYPLAVTFDAALESDSSTLTIRSATLRLGQAPLTIEGAILLRSDPPVVDLHVATSDASLTEAARLAQALGVPFTIGRHVEGLLTADLRATGPANRPMLAGHARLRNVVVSGAGLPRPVRTPAIDLSLTPEEIRSNDFQAITNGTSVTARFTLARYAAAKPLIEAGIRTAAATLADVLNIARACGVPGADRVSGAGRVSLDVRVAGPVDDPALSGTATVDEMTVKTLGSAPPVQIRHADLTFSGDGSTHVRAAAISFGALVLDDAQTDVSADHGMIRFDPLMSGLYGGAQRGSIAVDTTRTPFTIAVSSDLRGADANRMMTAALGLNDVVYGSLQSIIRVSFAGGGDILRTLNGTAGFAIPSGRIAHVDVLHEAGMIARFVAGRPPTGSTSVTAMSGSFTITNGVARSGDLVAAIDGGRVGAAGSIDLPRQVLALRVNVVLSRGFARAVGGTKTGNVLETMLANRQGDFVVPILVTGTLQRPLFAPDPARLAEMQVQKVVPTFQDPRGPAIRGERPAPQSEIEDLLRQILRGLEPAKKKPPRK